MSGRGLPPSLILAALGLGLALLQTRFGAGAGGDSSSYLMGAENLLLGNGFSRYSGGYEVRPITGFPPFYSTMLAAVSLFGLETSSSARLLNAALFAASIALVGYLVYAYSGSPWAAAVASASMLGADTLFELHTWVMSEPLFIFLTLAAIWSLLRALEGGGLPWLIGAALLTACSSLTRYVGPALSAAGFLVLLGFGAGAFGRRLGQASLFAALSLLPVALWLRRNAALAGTLVNRELAYHPMQPDLVRQFLAELSSWFVPHQVPLPTGLRAGLAVAIAVGLLGWFFFWPVRSWISRQGRALVLSGPEGARFRALPLVLGLYAAGSALILFVNSTFLDASTTATAPARYLAPIYAALVPLACLAGSALARRRPGGRTLGRLALAYAVALLGFYAAVELRMLADPIPQLGYTGRRLLWADAVAAIREVPAEVPLVSNNPELVYILVGRPAYVRPISFDNYQQAARSDYEEQFRALEEQLRGGGVFVLFDELEPDDQAFIDRMGLSLLETFPQVRLFQAPAAGSQLERPGRVLQPEGRSC
jgi:4-amino-4-deoxy-L-arabinose transferase-like glycosyltransferase